MRPRFAKIYTWAQVAAMPATEYGPWKVMGCDDLARDPRTGMIVPAELVCRGTTWRLADDVNSWFDTTSLIEACSLNLVALKTGWALGGTSPTGGWVAGPASTPILCRAQSGQTSTLAYTIPGRVAADHIMLIAKLQATPAAGSTNNVCRTIFGDALINSNTFHTLARGASSVCAWAAYTCFKTAVSTNEWWKYHCFGYPKSADCLSKAPVGNPYDLTWGNDYYGLSATNVITFSSDNPATAANNDLTVTAAAIYLGGYA